MTPTLESSPDNSTSAWEDGEAGQRRINRVRRRMLAWGRANYQFYEWRAERDPWLTLVSEWLLQRTRARQAERAFRVIRDQFPTAESLVRAGSEAARGITDLIGLHWRAPHLYELANTVWSLGGVPPESPTALRRITGVGMYTSAAWLSLHRNRRAAIVDSNVARWLARLTGRPYQRDPRSVRWLQVLSDRLTPRRAFRDYNYAVIDFTMLVCTVRVPHCQECPLRTECEYGRAQPLSVPRRPSGAGSHGSTGTR